MHTVPLRGGFVDMLTHEQHIYYILLLIRLVEARGDIEVAYIDNACRIGASYRKYLAARPVSDDGHERKDLVILGNWMHAAGHVEACELVMSGLFSLGAGRRVGENTEQFWAQSKARHHAAHLPGMPCTM